MFLGQSASIYGIHSNRIYTFSNYQIFLLSVTFLTAFFTTLHIKGFAVGQTHLIMLLRKKTFMSTPNLLNVFLHHLNIVLCLQIRALGLVMLCPVTV